MQSTNHKVCSIQLDANARPSECQAIALPVRPLRVEWCDILSQCLCHKFSAVLFMNATWLNLKAFCPHLTFSFIYHFVRIFLSQVRTRPFATLLPSENPPYVRTRVIIPGQCISCSCSTSSSATSCY